MVRGRLRARGRGPRSAAAARSPALPQARLATPLPAFLELTPGWTKPRIWRAIAGQAGEGGGGMRPRSRHGTQWLDLEQSLMSSELSGCIAPPSGWIGPFRRMKEETRRPARRRVQVRTATDHRPRRLDAHGVLDLLLHGLALGDPEARARPGCSSRSRRPGRFGDLIAGSAYTRLSTRGPPR